MSLLASFRSRRVVLQECLAVRKDQLLCRSLQRASRKEAFSTTLRLVATFVKVQAYVLNDGSLLNTFFALGAAV